MPATISAAYEIGVTVTQTLTGQHISPANRDFVARLVKSGVLTASSSVPATKQASGLKALAAGAGTLDLTALPGDTADETVDATGLKLQILIVEAPTTNANPITIEKGDTNGYGLDAAGTAWSETLDPGQCRAFFMDESAPDVASGVKVLDLTGTGTQALDYLMVFG